MVHWATTHEEQEEQEEQEERAKEEMVKVLSKSPTDIPHLFSWSHTHTR